MSTEVFDLYIQQSLEKLESLWQRSNFIPNPENELSRQRQLLLQESLSELSGSIEELQLACETLRQQNEQLLASRQQIISERQYYQQLFDFAPDCYLVTTKDGTIKEVNQKTTELLKVSPQYLSRKSLAVFIAVNYRQEYYTKLNQLKRGEITETTWQLEIIDRQQNVVIAECTVNTIGDRSNEANELCWRISAIPANYQLQNSASLTPILINSLRSPLYNLAYQLEEIKADSSSKPSTSNHYQLLNKEVLNLQNIVNDGYILNELNDQQDLKLSLIDYAIFISGVVHQYNIQNSNLETQIVIDVGKSNLVGICDVLLLKQILTNIFNLALADISGDCAVKTELSKESNQLVIKINFLVNNQSCEKLVAIFSGLVDSNSLEYTSEENMYLATIQKCIYLLQGKSELDFKANNINIIIKLPLVANANP
ncbi:MAG: PAS domain-containing protein [Cyanobacteria bacterium P01_A01_bin.40]